MDFREDQYEERMRSQMGDAGPLTVEKEKPRKTDVILAIVFGVAAFCWFYYAHAAETFRARGEDDKDAVVIVLRDGECNDKDVLEYLSDALLDDRRFKKADLEWEGESFGACWVDKDGYVYAIGSDKKPIRPPIPRSAFKDDVL